LNAHLNECPRQSLPRMIRKSGNRFSEKIMRGNELS
jgi:hypothetical protein